MSGDHRERGSPDRPPCILVVDDDQAFRLSTAALLRDEGYRIVEAEDGEQARLALEDGGIHLVLLDMRMPGIDGIDLVEVLRTRGEHTPILMISGFGTVDAAVRALHVGADDFLTKPVEPDVLTERVAQLLSHRPTQTGSTGRFGLTGRSEALREVLSEVEKVGPSDTTVLITGETGTGKELIARAVHQASLRREGPFVPVNCAAFASGLLESELFGHTRGAFTGAVQDKVGLFKAADGGTLFLDEVGDLAEGAQKRLLRALQEREITPVGSVRPVSVDVRLVAATNQDLERQVEEGMFRADLYYRLNVFRIRVPPLRERPGDVPLLVEHFFRQRGSSAAAVSPLALRLITRFPWPGNVRQLFATLEGAWVRSAGEVIQANHLPPEVREGSGALSSGPNGGERYRAPVEDGDERQAIVRALEAAGGVRAHAAHLLGMGRTTLWRKMREYGLDDGEPG
ncbi:MAG: sigma-54 dependent transcriptional regulator [Gemmatimonadota bacterium]|nr:sigma-54 dependent transcriptional regulator [Gemmatimonadota bacterium]